jgi:hypothetical protein
MIQKEALSLDRAESARSSLAGPNQFSDGCPHAFSHQDPTRNSEIGKAPVFILGSGRLLTLLFRSLPSQPPPSSEGGSRWNPPLSQRRPEPYEEIYLVLLLDIYSHSCTTAPRFDKATAIASRARQIAMTSPLFPS